MICVREVEKKKVLEKLKSQTKQRTSDRGSTGQCLCPVMSNHYGVETLNKNENVTKISLECVHCITSPFQNQQKFYF